MRRFQSVAVVIQLLAACEVNITKRSVPSNRFLHFQLLCWRTRRRARSASAIRHTAPSTNLTRRARSASATRHTLETETSNQNRRAT